MSNKKRNTQIPIEAIGGAAGINDKFVVNAGWTYQYLYDINKEPTRDNAETKVSGSAGRTINSMELKQGMIIKAEPTRVTNKSEIEEDKTM